MRLVLDTNIVVSALIWGGNPKELIAQAVRREVELFTSEPLRHELDDVLAREKFARQREAGDVSWATYALAVGATFVALPAVERLVPSDPDDDAVVATALAAQADVIATGDRDLLSLHPYRGIQILNAADALRHVRTLSGV